MVTTLLLSMNGYAHTGAICPGVIEAMGALKACTKPGYCNENIRDLIQKIRNPLDVGFSLAGGYKSEKTFFINSGTIFRTFQDQ